MVSSDNIRCIRKYQKKDGPYSYHAEVKRKRSGDQCLKWAVRGRFTCHMHGGTSKGSITKAGKERSRQAAFRHGGYTKQAKTHHQKIMVLIRQSKDLLQGL